MKTIQFVLLLSLLHLNPAVGNPTPLDSSDYVVLPQGIIAKRSEVNFDGPVSWGKYPPAYYWGDTSIIDLKDKPLLFLTHHSSSYDSAGVATAGAKTALETFLSNEMPVFYLYSFRFASEKTFRFLDFFTQFVPVESEGGENKLRYTRGKNFFFTGGHLSLCLCETIRDTLRSIADAPTTDTIHFYLVSEGIYDFGRTLGEHSLSYTTTTKGYQKLVLDRLVRSPGTADAYFCQQNWKKQPEVRLKNYSIDVVDFDGSLKTLSQGNQGHFVFHLVNASNIDSILKKIEKLRW